MNAAVKTVLWWGRFDPHYSRNRILRQAYAALGWKIVDFQPLLSALGDFEALLRRPAHADLVHVPCFRQRDIAAAARYARRHALPLLVDPLISAYDKQVFERAKFAPDSTAAKRLRDWEQQLLRSADAVLADTPAHAHFFGETFAVAPQRLHVVYVGAEEPLFMPGATRAPNKPIEVLFYGSFIALQGPQVIIEAARHYSGAPVQWTLLGDGPMRAECARRAQGLSNVRFEDWLAYTHLPERIQRADILLGVFGASAKAGRVIPNKVFQALACAKPLVTCHAAAYPEALGNADGGIAWVPAGDATALATRVAQWASQPQALAAHGRAGRASYERFFSNATIRAQLTTALSALGFTPAGE